MRLSELKMLRAGALFGALLGCVGSVGAEESAWHYVGSGSASTSVAEIVSYDRHTNRVFTTNGVGVDVYEFGSGFDIALSSTIDLSGLFGGDLDSVTSVAIDPMGRGFGVAVAVPTDNLNTLGQLIFFDTSTGGLIKTLDVGYHPDMVTFTSDGSHLLVANEGEASTDPTVANDPNGSLSVIDLGGKVLGDLVGLAGVDVRDYDFGSENLGAGVSLSGIRVDPRNVNNVKADLEPEYISIRDGKAYVTLQENNAVGVFDLASRKWTNVHSLGGVVQRIDASGMDGGINIDDSVYGLHMPDALGSYKVDGKVYFVTANEGDARDGVLGEESRVGELDLSAFDDSLITELNGIYGDFQADEALGRLKITTLDGDTDGNGKIDRLVMYGTRSFSIFDGETGVLVSDSGSDFEVITAEVIPELFNGQGNDPENFEARSGSKGPEAEGVAVAEIDGRILAAITLERVGGVMIYDVTDPASPEFVQYLNSNDSHGTGADSPEGITWVTGADSPTGESFLLVAYEESGSVDVFRFGSAIPEPGSVMLLGLGLGFVVSRRK